MKFNMRKFNAYAICSIEDGGAMIDLGMLDLEEAKQLLSQFEQAVDDLKWFVNDTER